MYTGIHRVVCAFLAAAVVAAAVLGVLYSTGIGNFDLGSTRDPLDVHASALSRRDWVGAVEVDGIDAATLGGLGVAMIIGLGLIALAVRRDPVKYVRLGDDVGLSRSAIQDLVDDTLGSNVRIAKHRTKVVVGRADRRARISIRAEAREGVDRAELEPLLRSSVDDALESSRVPLTAVRWSVSQPVSNKRKAVR